MVSLPASQCIRCSRLVRPSKGAKAQCEAFPDGIPREIIFNEVDHTKPYPGDGGLLYAPTERWAAILAGGEFEEEEFVIDLKG